MNAYELFFQENFLFIFDNKGNTNVQYKYVKFKPHNIALKLNLLKQLVSFNSGEVELVEVVLLFSDVTEKYFLLK